VWKKKLHVTATWRELHQQYTNQRYPKGYVCRCDTCETSRAVSRSRGETKSTAEGRGRAREAALASFNARAAEEEADTTSGTSSDDESEHNKRVLKDTYIKNYWDAENAGKVGDYNDTKHEYTVTWPHGEGAPHPLSH
jgi:hypothetical protein